MRLDRRSIAIIILILAIIYSKDILKGNFKPLFKSIKLLKKFINPRNFIKGLNIRGFSMINKGINSLKNKKFVENIKKKYNTKKTDKNEKKTKTKNKK